MCGVRTDELVAAVLRCSRSCSEEALRRVRLHPEKPGNHVLRALGEADRSAFAQLMRELEPCPLQGGALLATPRSTANFLYFVESGIVSLVASTGGGHSVEVALVGREGVAGLADALGQQPLP